MNNPHIESIFHYKGYPCAVLLQPMGHRCGYVGIDSSHPLYKKDYNIIDIDCHGGITYSGDCLPQIGLKITYNMEDIWWIGFDCAHADDANDYDAALKIFKDKETIENLEFMKEVDKKLGKVRTQEYVKQECRNIVDQLEQER